jgi:hypothetical protein
MGFSGNQNEAAGAPRWDRRSARKAASVLALMAPGLACTPSAHALVATADGAAAATGAQGDAIIVSATKREASLEDVPVAVSVASGQAIARAQIRDLKDLTSLVPSLSMQQLQSPANVNIYIRGFGNGANNSGIEPSVGVFVDGVYRSRTAAQIADCPMSTRWKCCAGRNPRCSARTPRPGSSRSSPACRSSSPAAISRQAGAITTRWCSRACSPVR